MIDATALSSVLRGCTSELAQHAKAVDAEDLMRALDNAGIPNVMVTLQDERVCFEQTSTAGTISELLRFLDVRGALVHIHGSACDHETAAQIVNGGGDYFGEVPAVTESEN